MKRPSIAIGLALSILGIVLVNECFAATRPELSPFHAWYQSFGSPPNDSQLAVLQKLLDENPTDAELRYWSIISEEQGWGKRKPASRASLVLKLKPLADARFPLAEGKLGWMLVATPVEATDRTTGLQLLQRAAEANDGASLRNLGTLYVMGLHGTPRDVERGETFLEKAESLGVLGTARARSQILLDKGDYEGAAKLLVAAGEKGDYMTFLQIAAMYRSGKAQAIDLKKAAEWVERACQFADLHDQSVSEPVRTFAVMLATGEGTERDTRRAYRLFERCAAGGDMEAEVLIAKAKATGVGTKVDYKGAIASLTAAATAGLDEAQTSLGTQYLLGLLVPRDVPKAKALLKAAAKQENQEARRLLVWIDHMEREPH